MTTLRRLALALAFLVPATALAATQSSDCCVTKLCCHAGCPFCPH